MAKRSLEEILADDSLGLLDVKTSKSSRLSKDSIYFSVFEEVAAFQKEYGRLPTVETANIHEAKLATRYKNLCSDDEVLESLKSFDTQGILPNSPKADASEPKERAKPAPKSLDDIFDSDLLDVADPIFEIKHVTSSTKTQSTNEYMARRKPCEDFDAYKPLFKQIQEELNSGVRQTRKVEGIADIKAGQSFILSGLIAYVASVGEKYEHRKGHHNARTRVIFSNGMESDLLLRSFGAALYKDKSARAITGESLGPLFETKEDPAEYEKTGIVYVLRSRSELPEISKHQAYLHKIGVTKSNVKARLANAAKDPTYLLADVEVVAEFTLYNMNLRATEQVLHTFFREAQADLEITDRFGNAVKPREWFFVPLDAIREAVKLLNEGKLASSRYDAVKAVVLQENA